MVDASTNKYLAKLKHAPRNREVDANRTVTPFPAMCTGLEMRAGTAKWKRVPDTTDPPAQRGGVVHLVEPVHLVELETRSPRPEGPAPSARRTSP